MRYLILILILFISCQSPTKSERGFKATIQYSGFDPEFSWYTVIESEAINNNMIRVNERGLTPPKHREINAILDTYDGRLFVLISYK